MVLLLTATTLQVTHSGGWPLALIAVLGILLVLGNYTPEGKRT